MMLLRLAWRNIWRNSRRSLIVLCSIVVGMAATVFTDSFYRGFMKQMFENQLGSHTSHIQIHARGFNDNKVVQNSMADYRRVISTLESHPNVAYLSRRIIAFGLLSSASNSSGVSIIGINPGNEAKITTIQRSVVAGGYLSGEKHEIVISKRLAATLGIGLGDRVVAMASALDGKVGSDVFRVVGLYESASSSFDRMYIYISLENAQGLLRVGDRISEVAVVARDINSVPNIKRDLVTELNSTYEVLSYQDLLPSLLMQLDLMDQMMLIFYAIIGLAMIFGIVNTMLMSVFERIREFGVLKAVGMKNGRLFLMVMLEAFFLGLLGVGVGGMLGVAVDLTLSATGLNFAAFAEGLASYGAGAIIYPELSCSGLVSALLLVLLFCVLAAVYPAYKAVRLQPISAIRHV